jgi:hypothetical protein
LVALALPSVASAEFRLRGIGSIGAEFGGDELASLTFSDGSEANVSAGRGLSLKVGVDIQTWSDETSAIDAVLMGGIKFAMISQAVNQDVTWSRYPVELLVFYHHLPAKFRIGLGGTMHFSPTLSFDGDLLTDEVEFKNSFGFLIHADYFFNPALSFGARYTIQSYTRTTGSPTVSGNSFGLDFSFHL